MRDHALPRQERNRTQRTGEVRHGALLPARSPPVAVPDWARLANESQHRGRQMPAYDAATSRALSAYESTAALEHRQNLQMLLGIDDYA